VSKDGRLVIISNRLPVRRVRKGGKSAWEQSPGGLVTAMSPILEERGGAWVGWAGDEGKAPRPFKLGPVQYRPVAVNRKELDAFYYGFSNQTLWPLYHDALRPPVFRRRWWWPYMDINRRFAEAAAETMKPGDIVWVHDYHLQLVPGMLRELRPDARIGFFLHIPFPPEPLFAHMPWRQQVLEGMLGADLLGFQTKVSAENFIDAAKRFTKARGRGHSLRFEGRTSRVGAFSISIDTKKFETLAASPDAAATVQELRFRLGDWRRVLLGVDRLDYTKGIDARLRAFEELLSQGKVTLNECVFVQIAVPSRESVREYAALRAEVEQLVGRINGEYGEPGMAAVHYLHRGLPPAELAAHYLAGDVMVVTPFRDGMNLVAKEYVATRLDNSGVLVLSEFTGAAEELKSALLVNPHDIDGLAAAYEAALHISPQSARRRMASLRKVVRANDVYQWADHYLEALVQ